MNFHFKARVALEDTDDPFLRGLQIEAQVRIHCSSFGDEVDFGGLEIARLHSPDPDALLKARALLGAELEGRLLPILERQVAKRWGQHYDRAMRELESIYDAAEEARYDSRMDG